VGREHEGAIEAALAKAGTVYTRNASRAPEAENVVDSKLLMHLRLFNLADIPPRESVKLDIEVGDVDASAKALESELKGRIVDVRHTREASGQRESAYTIDVPLSEMPLTIERLKSLGTPTGHVTTRNAGILDNRLAIARLEVRLANAILIGNDSGPAANIKKGLAISLQAASWALMLIIIGICFIFPLVLAVWGCMKLLRKLRPKAPAAAAV